MLLWVRVIGDVLRAAGHAVTLVSSGAEALAAVRAGAGQFDAVLLDLTMPEMSGDECLLALRELRADLPVILTSGYSEIEARRRVGDHTVAGFLKKPFDMNDIIDCLRAALS